MIKTNYLGVEYSVSCEQDLRNILERFEAQARFWEEIAEEREMEANKMFAEILRYRRFLKHRKLPPSNK